MMKLDAFQVANQGTTQKLGAKKMGDSYLSQLLRKEKIKKCVDLHYRHCLFVYSVTDTWRAQLLCFNM